MYPESFTAPAPLASADPGLYRAGRLADPVPPFPQNRTCGEAFEWFQANPKTVAVAVVDGDGRVVALANRLRFLSRYAQRFAPELWGKHPVTRLANTNPLVVDEAMPIHELSTALTLDASDALRECFVVTRGGRYFGIGTSEALVRSKIEMLAASEQELKAALERAQRASRAKTDFLALMSHELRTPLNAIIGFSDVVGKELFGPIGVPRYREYVCDINAAGRHLLSLINDILDLSKSEAGKLEPDEATLSLPPLFDDCVRLLRIRADEFQIALSAECERGLPALRCDARRVKQIVLNLLSNAVKFTPEAGKVFLSAGLAADGGIVLAVRDTGIGMAPEMIPVALEPFRQIASPFARNVEGTGLGLTLVRSFAELHQAKLHIESALNQGTTVRLHFPPDRSVVQPLGNTGGAAA